MKKVIGFTSVFLFYVISTFAQPYIQWSKTFGGSDEEAGKSIIEKDSNTFICLGYASSSDGDVSYLYYPGSKDFWLCVIDSNGILNSDKTFGGGANDEALKIFRDNNSGYLLFGSTSSIDGQVIGNHSWAREVWLTGIDDSLNFSWQKCFGSTMPERAYSITQTLDSGYLFIAETQGNDFDVSGNHGLSDIWLCKIDKRRNLLWQSCFGDFDYNNPGSVLATNDGGVIMVNQAFIGNYCSSLPEVNYLWITKLDTIGNIQWEQCLGGGGSYDGAKVIQDNNNGYYVGGLTFGGNSIPNYHGAGDCYIAHIDSSGNLLWENCIGGSAPDELTGITLDTDSSVIICGFTDSNDGQAIGNHGQTDAFIAKLDSQGNCIWSKCFGGSRTDLAYDVIVSNDGSIVFSGMTNSSDGDVNSNHGANDMWVVKLVSPAVGISNVQNYISEISANYTSGKLSVLLNSTVNSKTQISITSILGKVEFDESKNIYLGKNQFEFELPALSGIYILNVGESHLKFVANN